MGLAVDVVVMQFRAERRVNLICCARERDSVAAPRNAIDCETLLLEPCFNFCDIGVRHPKTGSKLVRRQPVVVKRGGWILLRGDQGLQLGLLGSRSLEHNTDPLKRGLGRNSPDIVCLLRHWGPRTCHDRASTIVDFGSNTSGYLLGTHLPNE